MWFRSSFKNEAFFIYRIYRIKVYRIYKFLWRNLQLNLGALLSAWTDCPHHIFLVTLKYLLIRKEFPGDSDGKESACNARDLDSIPRLRTSPGVGNGKPLQYSCLENCMDRGAWRAMESQRVKRWTWLSTHIHNTITMQILIKIKLDGLFVSE